MQTTRGLCAGTNYHKVTALADQIILVESFRKNALDGYTTLLDPLELQFDNFPIAQIEVAMVKK